MRKWLGRYWRLVLLAGIPVAAALELLSPERHTAIFFASAISIVPLAAYIGRATDELANRLCGGVGGLLNATFGNAAELIIGVLALRRGLTDLVKASLTGSIIGNVLLVQIALFVAPVLVFASYAVAPAPMDLLFTVFEVAAVFLAVLAIAFIAHDGETHWMEGVQLLAVYAILAPGLYFLPQTAHH